MATFTPYVGVAPATTTMRLNGLGGLGVCPPGHYGPAIMLPGAVQTPAANVPQATPIESKPASPYANEVELNGLRAARMLRGLSGFRWDLLLLGFGAAFAGVLGYTFYRVRRTKLL